MKNGVATRVAAPGHILLLINNCSFYYLILSSNKPTSMGCDQQ
jgi:hypothetical protein